MFSDPGTCDMLGIDKLEDSRHIIKRLAECSYFPSPIVFSYHANNFSPTANFDFKFKNTKLLVHIVKSLAILPRYFFFLTFPHNFVLLVSCIWYLRKEHDVRGSPMYPSGHVQTGWCIITLQFAFLAHGSLSAQGLMHFLFSHAV